MLLSIRRGTYDRSNGRLSTQILLDDADGRRWEDRALRVVDPLLAQWLTDLRTSGTYEAELDGDVVRGLTATWMEAVSRSPAPDIPPTTDDAVDADVHEVASRARRMMESDAWPRWNAAIGENDVPPGGVPSVGMCRMAASALVPVLRTEFPDGEWMVVGGHPSVAYDASFHRDLSARWRGMDGGLWDPVRQAWDGHYWVEGDRGGRRILVDVAADQYGWGPVIVAEAGDPRYRPNYKGSTIAKDMRGPKLADAVREFAGDWSEASPVAEPQAPAASRPAP